MRGIIQMKLTNPWFDKLVRIDLGIKGEPTVLRLYFSNFLPFNQGGFSSSWTATMPYTLSGTACAYSKHGRSKALSLIWSSLSEDIKLEAGDVNLVYLEMGQTWPRELRINKKRDKRVMKQYIWRDK